MKKLTIGQVAKAAKINLETIEYYEKRELLPNPVRSNSGYRLYSESTIEDIRPIKRAQEIGFTLKEIKQLLELVQQENNIPMEEMLAFAISKITEINEKMSKLSSFKSLLEHAVAQHEDSHYFSKAECPVLNNMKGDEAH